MLNQQLLDYIKQSLATGVNREEIKSSLLSVGWQEADIDEAIKSFNTGHEGFLPTKKIEPAIIQKSGLISKILIGVVLLIVIVLIAVGGYFYFYR